MGQCEGEAFGNYASSCISGNTSEFYAIANKCAIFSAAAIAAAAAHTTAVSPTTSSNAIAKFGADTKSTGQTARSSSKNMGHCIIKRGWWSREVLLSPGDAIFQSGIPSIGWWKLWGKAPTALRNKGTASYTIWSETNNAQYTRATMDGAQWSRSSTI